MSVATVTELFLLSEDHRIAAFLSSFDWKFSNFGEVRIRRGDISLRARQIGSGNYEGRPVIMLRPADPWDKAAALVRRIQDTPEATIQISHHLGDEHGG